MKRITTLFMALLVIIFLLSSCAQPGTATQTVSTTEVVTPNLPTATPTITATPTLPWTSFPAPAVPAVSAPISEANIGQFTRLSSLGEGDLLSTQLSPDEKWIVLGTRNGILVIDSATLNKSYFIPTQMQPYYINFLENGTEISALDRWQSKGGIWTFPEGKVIREVTLACKLDPTGSKVANYFTPSKDLQYAFTFIDNVAGLCNTADGQPVYTLNEQLTNWFLVSPDEKTLVFSTSDKFEVIRYLDGQVLKEVPETGIKSFFFYPDSKILATVYENQIKFWSTDDYQLIDTIKGANIQVIGFSPDNRVFAIRSGDLVRFLRSDDRKLINGISGKSFKYTSDGQGILVTNGKSSASYYQFSDDRSTLALVNSFTGWGVGYYQYDPGFLSNDNSQILLGKHEGDRVNGWLTEIVVYDIASGKNLKYEVPLTDNAELEDAVWLPNLQTFAVLLGSAFDRTTLFLLQPQTQTLSRLLGGSTNIENSGIVFTEDSQLIIYARGGVVTAWDFLHDRYAVLPSHENLYNDLLEKSSYIHSTPNQKFTITSISQRPNPGYRDSVVVSVNGAERAEFDGYTDMDLEFSPDSQMLAISTFSLLGGIHIEIFDLASGNKLFSTGEDYVEGDFAPKIAFSPDGKYFAVLPEVGYPQIWGIPQ